MAARTAATHLTAGASWKCSSARTNVSTHACPCLFQTLPLSWAPVVMNHSDGGRGKNRRVELVAR